MSADRAVCIHGHFYQPPRENPWREAVPAQDSADPFHDWNERIADECYAPCARARLLDGQGRVRRVMNVYARMSFNVGPTLLSWMEEADPSTYHAILDADRESQRRFSGHGSAIAQVYGHAVLPLATRRDKETQVRWGIRDFEHRFGRRPEALWLPETAVDVETLEVLASARMRYVILAPHQIRRIRQFDGAWRAVDAGSVDTTKPYLVRLPSGASIAVFVYDGAIAAGVSFGDLLENGDRLLGRLVAAPSGAGLTHIATDGETYGHHHRFGEMALAYVLEKLEARDGVRLTNYGEWLDAHPPADEVEIAPNTSWSCAHGVERWRSDCGCTTYSRAGWNQAWRTPLRRAVDELGKRLDEAYASRAGRLLRDPWAARDAYIDVILDPSKADRFLTTHAVASLDAEARSETLRLLEMQRHCLLASTSCGWYFADLAGIEAVQVLSYAARAIGLAEQLGERDVEEAFLRRIAEGRSNQPEFGDGRAIYEHFVRPEAVDAERAVREAVAATLFEREPPASRGIDVEFLEQTERRTANGHLVSGRARVAMRRTGEAADVVYVGVCGGTRVPHVGVARWPHPAPDGAARQFDERGADAAAEAIRQAFPGPVRLEEFLSVRSLADLEGDAAARALEVVEDGGASLALLRDVRIARSGALRGLALFALHRRLVACASSADGLEDLDSLLRNARAASLPVSGAVLAHQLGRTVAQELSRRDVEQMPSSRLGRLAEITRRARALAPDVNLWRAQDAYVQFARAFQGDRPTRDAVDDLGEALGIRLAASLP